MTNTVGALLADGTAAIAELGFGGRRASTSSSSRTRPSVHNVIVCTLCSCYPWPVLGLPPNWYKSPPYRARMVREPRKVLAEMGLELAESISIRVWDSSAEVRYLVLPERPPGSDGLRASPSWPQLVEPRRDDRGRAAMSARRGRDRRSPTMRGAEALPRDNGELVFAAPWEGRAWRWRSESCKSLGCPGMSSASRLIAEIAAQPERPYYESWLAALERLLRERGVLGEEQLAALGGRRGLRARVLALGADERPASAAATSLSRAAPTRR